ncbi:MAG: flagellin [Rhodospirillaceae bacterium]|nr:flagellin [Rhodospirillaceae bacterium]
MAQNITLSASIRANLLSLQTTNSLLNRTSERLATGLRVNSALDDPGAYFTSRSLTNRANDLAKLKDGIGQAIQTIKATDTSLNSITALVEQAQSLVTQAQEAQANNLTATVTSLEGDYNKIKSQVTQLISDAGYKGVNLLKNVDLKVTFNEGGSSTLTVQGVTLDGDLAISTAAWTVTSATAIDGDLTKIKAALAKLRTTASAFGTDLGIIQTREDFTTKFITGLQEGSGRLVDANLEEESANLLALQTRQSLGTTSLSFANQSQQSILQLFR